MNRVAIVDYGLSNLDSVARAVQECGADPVVTTSPNDLAVVTRIILPGVGVFAEGMRHLRELGYENALQEQVIGRHVPFLGICLGMQFMASSGSEGGETRGLGWIDGKVVRFTPTGNDVRIPHVGWNEVVHSADGLFRDVPNRADFYFVHSYHLHASHDCNVAARTPYCGGFVSAVRRDLIFGTQFHPEKSQRLGFQVLRNFLTC
jgi:glutamine amidotransferase